MDIHSNKGMEVVTWTLNKAQSVPDYLRVPCLMTAETNRHCPQSLALIPSDDGAPASLVVPTLMFSWHLENHWRDVLLDRTSGSELHLTKAWMTWSQSIQLSSLFKCGKALWRWGQWRSKERRRDPEPRVCRYHFCLLKPAWMVAGVFVVPSNHN